MEGTLEAAESSFHGALHAYLMKERDTVGDTHRRMDSRKELERKKKNPQSPETLISKSLEEANLTVKYKLAKLTYSTRMGENGDNIRIQWICRVGMRKMRGEKQKQRNKQANQKAKAVYQIFWNILVLNVQQP